MVKGNTHLWSAEKIRRKVKSERIRKTITSNLKYYRLGSFIPDSGFYCSIKSVNYISYWLHGKKGNLTNKIIFSMLDKIKKTHDQKDLALMFGYITHCALDITFHPMIFYLTGNYSDPSPLKLRKARYEHHRLETYIDSKFNTSLRIHEVASAKLIDDTSFITALSECMGGKKKKYKKALRNQLWFDKHSHSKLVYFFVSLFPSLKPIAGMMYPSLKKDRYVFGKDITYLDPINGNKHRASFQQLFMKGFSLSEKMIIAADKYVHNEITKKQAQKIIDGKSLDTGKVGVPLSKIRFTM
ncbi:zinc dependent phospholipase C family protein [Candidatus Woesearchaeota archaeon]|jgi:hypothetical protein|nr:zinc dependent phospholipase C family protein [Candidatus Woesearchaeota archaeon]MBT5396903.1 zinc dependent phospholipase C family protein [Candidatus Woesearchaeota archaeon]MBT5924508.1 zinc dependent phospholipase C family protein [Candidatus Woesearchaeota archaeon]MBT6367096.1 zinc dependent phospholipase C family protein [Candidatus Woesearchaeota archaeon]MBT7762330.1 zinc dependent phospholipase C family protein [Candidatus Woesearchaeota archaeon]